MKQLRLKKILGNQPGRAEFLLFTTLVFTFLVFFGLGVSQAAATEKEVVYDYSTQSLRAELWLDKSGDEIYRKGEHQTVGFQTNEDAYVVVYRVDTEGLVNVLWPRSRLDDGFSFGGHEYILPVSGNQRLRVSSQEGEGFVEAIVSRYPFDLRDLEIDFHHENGAQRLDFYVAGDPFLAMNEINFAVTGLEDSADYVITNYASYYVHQKVEHPRYLCVQCHDDNDVGYDPYYDQCSLDISYDYGWYNNWYDRYHYYPVYSHPVYVYVDPWSMNPWVNFWYTPYYHCAYTPHYSWSYSTYCWSDSPYYYGNSNVRYKTGADRYGPLGKPAHRSGKEARSNNDVTRMVRGTPSDDVRTAMRNKNPVSGSRNGGVRADGRTVVGTGDSRISDTRFKGENPVARPRTQYDKPATRGGQGGLRIRNGVETGGRSVPGGSRHVSSGAEGQRRSSGSTSVINRNPNSNTKPSGRVSTPSSGSFSKPARGKKPSSSTIRTVEPRQKGTRVWNNTRRNEGSNQADKPAQVKPSRRQNDGSRTGKQPERIKSRSSSSSSGKKQPKKTSTVKSRSSGSSSGSSGSSSKSSSVKKSSGSSSKSSGTRSSGGSSRSSGSKSSGGRSSSGNSKTRR